MRRRFFQKTTAWVILLTFLVIQCPVTTYGAISFGGLSEFSDRLGISSGLSKLSSGLGKFSFSLNGLSKFTNGLKSSFSGFANSLSSLTTLSGFNLKTKEKSTNIFNNKTRNSNKTIKSNATTNTNFLTKLSAGLALPSANIKVSSDASKIAGTTYIKKKGERSEGLSTSGLSFTAYYDSKSNTIKVSWASSVYDVVEIRRGVNGADDKLIDRFEGKSGSYNDKNVSKGNTYKYLLYVKYKGDYHGIANVTVKVPKK